MTDLLLQIGLSNLCLSLGLAFVACVVQLTCKRPFISHLLWLIVLIKLVTPPVLTIPLVAIPGPTAITAEGLMDQLALGLAAPTSTGAAALSSGEIGGAFLSAVTGSSATEQVKTGLTLIWLLGSAGILAWSLIRIYRFNRLLRMASEVAPAHMQCAASTIGHRLGLAKVPTIYITSARLSPLVWWLGGRVRILIPTSLSDQMEARQLQWILAHELAHVRRRDHLIRWLEWLACTLFWWNPVVWWARRYLRANEEVCCDALVLSSLKPDPRTYANSLFSVVEYLASPALRPPVMASEINSGGFLERRLRMIVSNTLNRPNSRWLQAWVLLCAVIVLPLGVAYADSSSGEADESVLEVLRDLVETGALPLEEAQLLYGTVLFPVSDNPRYLARAAGIDEMVKAGEMSAEEAVGHKENTFKYILTRQFAVNVLGKSPEEAELDASVAAGSITPEEAARRKAGVENPMEEYRRAEAEMQKMVDEGRLTKEDMENRLIEMRKAMSGKSRESKRFNREEYLRAQAEMQKMVDEGKISKEDMEKRLIEMRKAMSGDRGEHKGFTREDYARAQAEMQKMVDEGKIKKEDMEKRLIEMRKIMGGESSKRKMDLGRIKQRIEGAVEAGKMTREEADKFMEGIKKRLEMGESRERRR